MSSESTLARTCRDFLLNLRTRNLSPHTYRAYTSDLTDFQRFLGSGNLERCTKADLERYVQHLLQDRRLQGSSVKRRLACLRLLFSWLEEEALIASSPFRRFRAKIRLPRRLPRILNEQEMRALLIQPARELGILNGGGYKLDILPSRLTDDDFVRLGTLVAVELLFATGIRVGELTQIGIEDLDLANGIIVIQGKGNRQRRVFLPDWSLSQLLARYLDIRRRRPLRTDRLLVLVDGKPSTPAHVRRWLHRAAANAEITRRVTPHMIRHTVATQLLKAGIDIRAVQRLLGHASILTTQFYTEVGDPHLRTLICNRHPRRSILKGVNPLDELSDPHF